MEKAALLNFISQVNLFKYLNNQELEILGSFFMTRNYEKGSYVFKENAPSECCIYNLLRRDRIN